MTRPANDPVNDRVLSIDVLRGFDMFWIIGGGAIAQQLLRSDDPDSWQSRLSQQFEHVQWEGIRFWDLIFPLFLFLVGCVLPYSLSKYQGNPRAVYGRIFRRGFLLILFGLIYNDLLQLDFANMRYPQVLQRIGIGYVVAALIFLRFRWRAQLGITAAILLIYWAIFLVFATPGGQVGDYSMEGNLAGYIDRTLLPGQIWEAYYGYGDNEGILSTIPAIATAMIGVLIGTLIRSSLGPWKSVASLTASGLSCLAVGYLWSPMFPIIKNLWTSSFVLVAGGYSILMLAVCYTLVDVIKLRWLAPFWVVIGANAITIYMAQEFLDFRETADFFFGGIARLFGSHETLVMLIAVVAVKWLLLYFLFRKRIFLRV